MQSQDKTFDKHSMLIVPPILPVDNSNYRNIKLSDYLFFISLCCDDQFIYSNVVDKLLYRM